MKPCGICGVEDCAPMCDAFGTYSVKEVVKLLAEIRRLQAEVAYLKHPVAVYEEMSNVIPAEDVFVIHELAATGEPVVLYRLPPTASAPELFKHQTALAHASTRLKCRTVTGTALRALVRLLARADGIPEPGLPKV